MPLVNPGSGTDGITARRHYNGTTPLRYLKIILFFIFLPVPLFLLEAIFLVTGSGLSITDGNGVGQVSALLVVIAMVAVFSRFVAKERPFGFLYFYLRNWRPALRGFAIFGGVTLFLSVSAYAILWLFGKATISQEAIAAFNYKVFEDTVVTLLTALVVALTEEIVFRTFLMRYLRWNTTALVTVGAVLFSSFIFVISHRLDEPLYWFSGNNWQLFVGLFLLAVASVGYLPFHRLVPLQCRHPFRPALHGSRPVQDPYHRVEQRQLVVRQFLRCPNGADPVASFHLRDRGDFPQPQDAACKIRDRKRGRHPRPARTDVLARRIPLEAHRYWLPVGLHTGYR